MINFSALREAFNASLIKKACAIANSKKFKGGDYDHAYAAIEKLKKGLADEPKVAACLKKANESIALAEDDLEEGVSVDMRTKGYKEAIARSIAKEGKKKLKAENAKTLQDANNALLGKNENMTASGNDSTGPIAGHDKPLSKKKKIMKFKGFKESVELEEVFNQAQMKKAIGIARKSRGNYDKAYAEIEKIKKGLGDEDIIAHVLKKANESVEIEEGSNGLEIQESVNFKAMSDKKLLDWIKKNDTEDRVTPVFARMILTAYKEKRRRKLKTEEAYDRGSIRDFKVGDKVKFVDDKSSHHGQTGKITKLIGGIGARQKAHVKLDKTKKTVIDILTSTDLIKESVEEAVSMKNAKGIGFGKKGGYDKYVTLAKKKNAKSYKDVLKVLSREGLGKEELDNVADYVMNALGESVDFSLEDDSGLRDMITYTQLMEGANVKSTMSDLNKKMSLLKTDVKGGNINDIITRLTSIEIFMGKAIKDLNKLVKESVELEEAKGSDCTIQNDGRNNIAVCIDGLSFADARKGTRGAMMNIDGFKKKAKVAWADAKGKPTIPAVKKEIKALKAKNFYAKWQADSSSYKDDSVKIWFTK